MQVLWTRYVFCVVHIMHYRIAFVQRIHVMLPYNLALNTYFRKLAYILETFFGRVHLLKCNLRPGLHCSSRSLIHHHRFIIEILNMSNPMRSECYFRTGEPTRTRKLAFFTTWHRRDPEPGTVAQTQFHTVITKLTTAPSPW